MDQDPTPGVFEVDRLVSDNSVTYLSTSQRFQLTPETAPEGFLWATGMSTAIPGRTNSSATPAANAWQQNSYDFGTLDLESDSTLECVAGNVYSVSKNGQLQRAMLDSLGTSVRVTNVGSSAGADSFNGLGIGDGGKSVFAYERGNSTSLVYKFNTVSRTWSSTRASMKPSDYGVSSLVAGAVAPDGVYWAGGFNSLGNFQLWAMNSAQNGMSPRGQVDLRSQGWALAGNNVGNGDMAFDTLGNLFVVRGSNNGTRLDVFRVDAAALKGGSGNSSVRAAQNEQTGNSPFSQVNGVAYDSSGKLFIGGDGIGFMTLPLAKGSKPTNLGRTAGSVALSTTDLASCGYPPTITLQKDLPDGRVAVGDQFKLKLEAGNDSSWETETSGDEVGLQKQTLGPIPVMAGGMISISETVVGNTGPGNYASRWECKVGEEVLAEGTGRSNDKPITIPVSTQGKDVICTFTNTIAQAKKTAVPASGTAVHADDANKGIVRYTLSFDNKTGPTATDILYSDYLSDVLDDAVFVDGAGKTTATPVVTTTGGIVYNEKSHWDEKNKVMTVQGKVAARSEGSLSFSVRVLPNTENSEARGKSSGASNSPQGYFLRNKLARGTSKTPPTECKPGLCTEHPINAWTVTKGSLPANDARLHKGGNVHYKVTASKANAQTTLNGLVLTDDLTHVFKSAGWAPNAAVPGGAVGKGVYLFNSEGRTIGLDGRANSGKASEFVAVRDVAEPKLETITAEGGREEKRWIVTSGAPLNLPKEAERAEMWFAVVAAESPAGIPNPSIWAGQGNAPASGWVFANYATGMAAKQPGSNGGFAPNECATGTTVPDTSAAPNSAQPVDTKFPSTCRTQHELSQNYFTIRKDAAGAGLDRYADDLIPGTTEKWDPDSTGLWNMVGHKFEVRNNVAGEPSTYPAVELCRTDYAADDWNGAWVSSTRAADTGAWDFGQNSKTLQKLIDWNAMHPDNQKPLCGTIYPIAEGGQAGRWRSENLERRRFLAGRDTGPEPAAQHRRQVRT